MKVVVASTNPVKVKAVEESFKKVFENEDLQIEPISVDSGVAGQPMNDEETLQGARNRSQNAKNKIEDADYWVGIEGGLEFVEERLSSFTWVVVTSKETSGEAKTGTFFLPSETAKLINEGKELGEANDILFQKTNSKQGNGAVGIFTKGVINRDKFYEDAVVLALIPFIHSELFS